MTRGKTSEAWERPGAAPYLPTPPQGMLFNEMQARVVRAGRADLYSFPVGRSVASVNEETSVREVMRRLQEEHPTAVERMAALMETA